MVMAIPTVEETALSILEFMAYPITEYGARAAQVAKDDDATKRNCLYMQL